MGVDDLDKNSLDFGTIAVYTCDAMVRLKDLYLLVALTARSSVPRHLPRLLLCRTRLSIASPRCKGGRRKSAMSRTTRRAVLSLGKSECSLPSSIFPSLRCCCQCLALAAFFALMPISPFDQLIQRRRGTRGRMHERTRDSFPFSTKTRRQRAEINDSSVDPLQLNQALLDVAQLPKPCALPPFW